MAKSVYGVGKRIQVRSEGGLDKGKQGTIVPWVSDWRSVPNTGLYKAPNPKDEVWIRYDDGSINTMFKVCLTLI